MDTEVVNNPLEEVIKAEVLMRMGEAVATLHASDGKLLGTLPQTAPMYSGKITFRGMIARSGTAHHARIEGVYAQLDTLYSVAAGNDFSIHTNQPFRKVT